MLKRFADPRFAAPFHKWAAIAWFLAAFPIMALLATSIEFLVFISVYAVVAGHWSGYQAGCAELEAKD